MNHDNLEFASWSKLSNFDHLAYARVSWSNGQKFLTMTMAKILRITILAITLNFGHGHGQKFLTIWPWHPDVGQMVKKSWSSYTPLLLHT